MKIDDITPSRSISRRSLIAAASIVMTAALGTKARGQGHGRGHGRGHGHGGGRGGGHCFLRGTSIRTPSGEHEISTLAVGDLVLTYSGEAKPIKWIGHRRLARGGGQTWSWDVSPIKIARSALADDVPHSDLYVSPQHGLYLNKQLITAGSLVNGRTILRCRHERNVLEYFHLELSDHNLIFAEGLVTETLIPFDRANFDNWWEDQRKLVGKRSMPAISAGARLQLQSRIRSAFAPVIDMRTSYDKVRDYIEERAGRYASG